jgi:stalled ribosome rescue protein Dom34
MRILRRTINEKTKEGSVQLQADQDEDMYSLYNLILKGDVVEAMTIRNVTYFKENLTHCLILASVGDYREQIRRER